MKGNLRAKDSARSYNTMLLIDSTHELNIAKFQLISDKIAPPAWAPGLGRTRLLDMLNQSVAAGTSTVLSGRAGTGKTFLALDFARKCGRAVAWYKIDAPDADPAVFFNYLITSIRACRPQFGSTSLTSLSGLLGAEQMTWLADAFVYELVESKARPLLVVIEDLHLVSDADWLVPFFYRLLPLLPSDVHLLITSRNLPPAPLWRMRSKQSLVVMDEETLAFTRAEAVALFESYGLSSDQASIALDHTHGRAASLCESAAFLSRTSIRAR